MDLPGENGALGRLFVSKVEKRKTIASMSMARLLNLKRLLEELHIVDVMASFTLSSARCLPISQMASDSFLCSA